MASDVEVVKAKIAEMKGKAKRKARVESELSPSPKMQRVEMSRPSFLPHQMILPPPSASLEAGLTFSSQGVPASLIAGSID